MLGLGAFFDLLFLVMADGAFEEVVSIGLTGSGVSLNDYVLVVSGSGDRLSILIAAGASESHDAIGVTGSFDGHGAIVVGMDVRGLLGLFFTSSEQESGSAEEEQSDQSNEELQELSG